jgi:peptide/nickel transport system substrate-binding protein
MRTGYRSRWPLLLALVAGVSVLTTLAYTASHRSGVVQRASGGTYVEGVAGAPQVPNPLYASFNQADADLSALIFAGLVRLGPSGSLQPDLAELPRITPDGLTYIFSLRSGLFWQDREPLTSTDVAFTIKLIQDPKFQGDATLKELFRGVQVQTPDQRTITMTLPQPFAPFLALGATVGILPNHLLGDVPASELATAPFEQHPVGSGPFQLTELSNERAVLEPFDGYYQGRPRLDALTLRFYRDDAALLKALHNDEIGGALFGPTLSKNEIGSIDGQDSLARRALHGTTMSLVYLSPLVPAFSDPLVRQALQHGLDRDALINDALAGQALSLDSPIVRDLWAYAGSLDAYAFDASQAESLLDQAGWTLDGGVRAKDGVPLAFSLATSDDPVQQRFAQGIAQQWAKLGAQVTVQPSSASQFVEGVLLPRKFQAALVVVDSGPDPDPYPLWDSSQAKAGGRNLAIFSDSTADRLVETARQEVSVVDRAAEYRQFQDIFARQLPAVLLYTPMYQYVVRSDVLGLSPGLLTKPSARFTDVYKWNVRNGAKAGAN